MAIVLRLRNPELKGRTVKHEGARTLWSKILSPSPWQMIVKLKNGFPAKLKSTAAPENMAKGKWECNYQIFCVHLGKISGNAAE